MTTNGSLLTDAEIEHLMVLARLSVRSAERSEVHGHRAGDWPGTRLGQGLDFEESRPYSPSDAFKDMDWRSTARLGHAYVKTYREERQPMGVLVVDRGGTMRFGSRTRLKVAQAARAAIWLGTQILAQGAAVSLVLWDEQDDWMGPFHGDDQWLRAVERLTTAAPPVEEPWSGSVRDEQRYVQRLQRLAEEVPAGARVFLLSDFLWVTEAHLHAAASLSHGRRVFALHISDPLEREFELPGLVSLVGSRPSETYWIRGDASQWRRDYARVVRQTVARQHQSLTDAGMGVHMLCSTHEDLSELDGAS